MRRTVTGLAVIIVAAALVWGPGVDPRLRRRGRHPGHLRRTRGRVMILAFLVCFGIACAVSYLVAASKNRRR